MTVSLDTVPLGNVQHNVLPDNRSAAPDEGNPHPPLNNSEASAVRSRSTLDLNVPPGSTSTGRTQFIKDQTIAQLPTAVSPTSVHKSKAEAINAARSNGAGEREPWSAFVVQQPNGLFSLFQIKSTSINKGQDQTAVLFNWVNGAYSSGNIPSGSKIVSLISGIGQMIDVRREDRKIPFNYEI